MVFVSKFSSIQDDISVQITINLAYEFLTLETGKIIFDPALSGDQKC